MAVGGGDLLGWDVQEFGLPVFDTICSNDRFCIMRVDFTWVLLNDICKGQPCDFLSLDL